MSKTRHGKATSVNGQRRQNLSRRRFIGLGLGGAVSFVSAGLLNNPVQAQETTPPPPMPGMGDMSHPDGDGSYMAETLVGSVDHARNGFDPMQMLVDWNYGTLNGTTPDGRPVREFRVSTGDIEIEIAPGVFFPAWA